MSGRKFRTPVEVYVGRFALLQPEREEGGPETYPLVRFFQGPGREDAIAWFAQTCIAGNRPWGLLYREDRIVATCGPSGVQVVR